MNEINQLVYVTDEEPGYRRKKWGRGHRYYAPEGQPINKEEIADRLDELVIPPMWEDVWICTRSNGHLQATGRDEKGRKQYLYHSRWMERQSRKKFDRLIDFAGLLPKIREQLDKDLRRTNWPKERVLALVVSLLDETYVRIGNQEYVRQNNTYGLTTLRRKHLKQEQGQLLFSYTAKSGVQQNIPVESKRLKRLVRKCSELPGHQLFKYYPNGQRSGEVVDSADVNAYLKEISGADFTSKTFRTWGGTVSAVAAFEEALKAVEENPRRELSVALVERVAKRLGNTVAVCRSHYIHPCILDCVEDGSLKNSINRFKTVDRGSFGLKAEEQITLKLLKKKKEEVPEIQLLESKKSA